MVEHDQGRAIFLQNDIHILLWDKYSFWVSVSFAHQINLSVCLGCKRTIRLVCSAWIPAKCSMPWSLRSSRCLSEDMSGCSQLSYKKPHFKCREALSPGSNGIDIQGSIRESNESWTLVWIMDGPLAWLGSCPWRLNFCSFGAGQKKSPLLFHENDLILYSSHRKHKSAKFREFWFQSRVPWLITRQQVHNTSTVAASEESSAGVCWFIWHTTQK